MPEINMENQRIYERPVELLQNLIRFDTTNPPGNEGACIAYLDNLLKEAGFSSQILEKEPGRPNLITRLTGRGDAPPLLLYGHVDVVTTSGQEWTHAPFEGKILDGFVWGRGALDMKSGIAMFISAILKAKNENLVPAGDIVLAVLCDEEAYGKYGAKYLIEDHAEQFEGIQFALGEFGGFSLWIGKQKFYPIQVAEKQVCLLKVVLHGPGGHGSMPMRGGSMSKLGHFLAQLEENRLPVHVTPVARQMISTMASALPISNRLILGRLLNPLITDAVLKIMGPKGLLFDPLLHNTVNATIVHGGEKINVIPSEIVVQVDGRLLPGYGPDDLVAELRQLIGKDTEIEVMMHDQGPAEPNMGMFNTLAEILRDFDAKGIAMPLMLPATTDARYFSKLGIQTYGFTPMDLPQDFDFTQTIHAANERIPIEAMEYGTRAIYRVMEKYSAA